MVDYEIDEFNLVTNKQISNLRIYSISNINYYQKYDLEKLNVIIEEAEMFKPDYICVMGKLCRDEHLSKLSYYNLCSFFYGLSEIAPVIVSTVSKEKLSEDVLKVFSRVSDFKNLIIINNGVLVIDKLRFTGIDLRDYSFDEVKEVLKSFDGRECDSDIYDVGLFNLPNMDKSLAFDSDLLRSEDVVFFEDKEDSILENGDDFPSINKVRIRK